MQVDILTDEAGIQSKQGWEIIPCRAKFHQYPIPRNNIIDEPQKCSRIYAPCRLPLISSHKLYIPLSQFLQLGWQQGTYKHFDFQPPPMAVMMRTQASNHLEPIP